MCNTEKLGGAEDEVNTSLLDMFKIQALLYTFVFIIGRCCPTRAIFFLEPVSTFFHKGGVKGQYLSTALAQNIDFNLLKMVL